MKRQPIALWLLFALSVLLASEALGAGANPLQGYPTATVPASDDWIYISGTTNSVRKLSPLYYQVHSTVLDSIAALTNSAGWLHNDGSGILSWSTPTYSQVGADQAGAAAAITLAGLGGVPTARTINTHALTANVTLTSSDVGAEPALGNPVTNGYVLASTTLGIRSWVAQSGGTPGGATNAVQYNTGSGFGGITVVNNAVLVTNGSGVPSESTTLPSGLTIPGYEPALGNPSTNGYVLSSTTGGVRSWVAQSGGGGGSPGGSVNDVQTNNGSGGFAGVPVTIDGSGNIVTSGSITVANFTAVGVVTYNSGIEEPIPTSSIPIQGRVETGYLAGSSPLTVGEVVSLNSSGVWVENDPTTPTVARGVSVAATSGGASASVLINGSFYWTGYSGLTVGSSVWATASGAMSASPPSGSGNYLQQIGYCTSADTVTFNFSGEYLVHQ